MHKCMHIGIHDVPPVCPVLLFPMHLVLPGSQIFVCVIFIKFEKVGYYFFEYLYNFYPLENLLNKEFPLLSNYWLLLLFKEGTPESGV